MSDKPFPPPYNTLGPVVIGMAFSTLLFGVVSLQTFNYYRNFLNDSWRLKALVGIVWVLELGHSISAWHGFFLIVVTFYGQPAHILNPPVTVELISLFAGILVIFVQGFFCVRIHRLSGKKWLAIFCFVLACSPLLITLKILQLFISSGKFSTLLEGEGKVLVSVATALVPVEHGVVAGVLVYYLLKMKRNNSFPRTRSMVDSIIVWTIETTLAATLVSVIELCLLLTRHDLVFFSFYIVHGKLVSNTLLTSLNGRDRFRDRGDTQVSRSEAYGLQFTPRNQKGSDVKNLDGSATAFDGRTSQSVVVKTFVESTTDPSPEYVKRTSDGPIV